jgi:hypothetical protein
VTSHRCCGLYSERIVLKWGLSRWWPNSNGSPTTCLFLDSGHPANRLFWRARIRCRSRQRRDAIFASMRPQRLGPAVAGWCRPCGLWRRRGLSDDHLRGSPWGAGVSIRSAPHAVPSQEREDVAAQRSYPHRERRLHERHVHGLRECSLHLRAPLGGPLHTESSNAHSKRTKQKRRPDSRLFKLPAKPGLHH